MTEWHWVTLPGLCAATALLELDSVRVGQWMVSRPICVGPLLGACLGDVEWGFMVGVMVEFLTAGDLPVGASLPGNGAVTTATTLLLSCSPLSLPGAAALPAGLLAGSCFSRLETVWRERLRALTHVAEARAARGQAVPFGRLVLAGLGVHACACALFLYCAVVLLEPALRAAWSASPETLRGALEASLRQIPLLGAASLLFALRPR